MIETHPFGNFIPENIQYLILGSFTSAKIAKGSDYDWFYSNGRNQFWKIIEGVYNLELTRKEEKIELFTKLNIGIVDIIYQCERKESSSLDNNLINIVYNPELEEILRTKHIKAIFFSSRFVENHFKKIFKNLIQEFPEIELITLPSPSPRYAAMSRGEKI